MKLLRYVPLPAEVQVNEATNTTTVKLNLTFSTAALKAARRKENARAARAEAAEASRAKDQDDGKALSPRNTSAPMGG